MVLIHTTYNATSELGFFRRLFWKHKPRILTIEGSIDCGRKIADNNSHLQPTWKEQYEPYKSGDSYLIYSVTKEPHRFEDHLEQRILKLHMLFKQKRQKMV